MTPLYAFELSGEHPTLPLSEAQALLEICSDRYEVRHIWERCLVVEASNLNLATLKSRLGMTHRVIQVLALAKADLDSVAEAAKDISIPQLRYRMRAKRLGNSTLPSNQVEQKVGAIFWGRGYRADLNDPEVDLRAIITKDQVVLGQEMIAADRRGFRSRRPHLKPFFHPGTMGAKLARALVNLSQVPAGDWLLDPLSGTGGFLVEAGLMNIKGIGLDVQEEIVRGAKANLQGLNCQLMVGDAMNIPLRDESVEGAVSDAPYGRSALVKAGSRDELVGRCLEEVYRVLISGRKMVFVDDRPIEHLIEDSGFDVLELHKERVHRSLTRHIFVCKK